MSFFTDISNIFGRIADVSYMVLFFLSLSGVVICMVLSIILQKGKSVRGTLSIIFGMLLACGCTIPLKTSFDAIVASSATGTVAAGGRSAGQLVAELDAKQTEVDHLKDQVAMLSGCKMQFSEFKEISELAVLETTIKDTKIYKELIEDKNGDTVKNGWGFIADEFFDEYLVIKNYDYSQKFGIDLNKIIIKKTSDDTVQVSRIYNMPVGGPVFNDMSTPVKELRRVNMKDGVIGSIYVDNNDIAQKKVNGYAEEKDMAYMKSISDPRNFQYLDKAVEALGKNYIHMILSPLYENIEFVPIIDSDAVSLEEFFAQESKSKSEDLERAREELEKIKEELYGLKDWYGNEDW